MIEIVKIDDGKVRLSNEELKRRAAKAIYEANIVVFDSLPGLIAQIIKHSAWEGFGHSSFADFALDATSNGLGVNSNTRLWLLRCAMDVKGEHMEEWAEIQAKIEQMVRRQAVDDGEQVGSRGKFDGQSLEGLAKGGNVAPANRITYLPSRNRGFDGDLIRLKKNHPAMFERVVAGEIPVRKAMIEARRKDGERVNHDKRPLRVRSDFLLLRDSEKDEFIEWLRTEGHIKSVIAKRSSAR